MITLFLIKYGLWTEKKVLDILKENSLEKNLNILDFVRYKVGEFSSEY